jgi:hypothetical protein
MAQTSLPCLSKKADLINKVLEEITSLVYQILGLSMINMGQMILSKPSIIIIQTYQDMMKWMSRMLVGEMQLVLMRILTQKLGKYGWFLFKPQPYLDSA